MRQLDHTSCSPSATSPSSSARNLGTPVAQARHNFGRGMDILDPENMLSRWICSQCSVLQQGRSYHLRQKTKKTRCSALDGTFSASTLSIIGSWRHIRTREPSAAVIPRAFPPFLLKWEIMSVVIGWKTQEGVIFATVLTLFDSSMKMDTISDMSVWLFFVINAQYVWLRYTSVMLNSCSELWNG